MTRKGLEKLCGQPVSDQLAAMVVHQQAVLEKRMGDSDATVHSIFEGITGLAKKTLPNL